MAGDMSYQEQKALVFKGLMLLAIITIVEVFIALLAKGHMIPSIKFTSGFGHYLYMLLMIGFSLYKAYFIVFYFMHMAYEVKGLMWSVLLPTLLLVWAIIAFFQEGGAWRASRDKIKQKNERLPEPAAPATKTTGSLFYIDYLTGKA